MQRDPPPSPLKNKTGQLNLMINFDLKGRGISMFSLLGAFFENWLSPSASVQIFFDVVHQISSGTEKHLTHKRYWTFKLMALCKLTLTLLPWHSKRSLWAPNTGLVTVQVTKCHK